MATTPIETTESTVLNIHNRMAELIEGYAIYVCDDGGGPFLSMNNPADAEDYRCLSLHDTTDSCSEDLTLYRWNFWSTPANVWLDSELGADASDETVLAFLAECLAEETRQLGTSN